jgi:hypothetical protein
MKAPLQAIGIVTIPFKVYQGEFLLSNKKKYSSEFSAHKNENHFCTATLFVAKLKIYY